MPYSSAPELKIRREQFYDRMASFIGFDFESSEFSDRFHVKSKDSRFAYDVIHPRMMEFLLADEAPAIMLEGSHCCIYTPNHCWSPLSFRGNVTRIQRFFELWSNHIISALQG